MGFGAVYLSAKVGSIFFDPNPSPLTPNPQPYP